MPKPEKPVVRAAGGIVTRVNRRGERQALLIHRPRYNDWSFPKGKCDSDDETYKQASLREVFEETGFRCELRAKLDAVEYVDRLGRPKRVQYWEMKVLDGEFAPNDEVDRIKWLPIDKALDRLTNKRDRRLLRSVDEAA